jgi:hypothetical protein
MQYLTHEETVNILANYINCEAFTDATDDDGNWLIRADNVPDMLDYLKNAPEWQS